MKIETVAKFETSHVGSNHTVIEARILTDSDVVICCGESRDSWPDSKERPASARDAVKDALDRLTHMLKNVQDVAKNAGLL